ncbi:MAG: hypothetical protein II738_05255, partial [Clostridia bacterium]|nr:hypothetical protein [Clostridia bacterium]
IDIYTEPNRGGLSISSASEKALKKAFEAAYGAHSEQVISDPVYKTGEVNGCYAFGVHFTESFGSTHTPAEAYLLATEEWQYLLVFRCFSFDFVMADDVQTLLDSFVMNGTLNPGDAPEFTVDFSGAITYEEELDAFDKGEGAGEREEETAEDEQFEEIFMRIFKTIMGTVITFGVLFDVFVLIMLVYYIRKYRLTKQANERYLRRYGFPAPDLKKYPAPPYPQAYAPYPQYPPASPYPAYPAYPPYPPPAAPAEPAPAEPAGKPSEPTEPDKPAETTEINENEEEFL